MTKKVQMMIASGLCALSVLAGNVCTWSGNAGDGKLGTPGNWDTLPVSGNGDTLDFSAASGSLTNDLGTLTVARLVFDGSAEVRMSGGKIVFNAPGTEVWHNRAKVTLDVPVQLSGAGTSQFYVYGSIDFMQDVTIDDNCEMQGRGPVQDGGLSPFIVVHFHGTVKGMGNGSKLSLGYGHGSNTYFHKPVEVYALKSTNLYNRDCTHFLAPDNKVTFYQPCYAFFVAECENAWGAGNFLTSGNYYTAETGTTVYDFKNHNQVIDGLHAGDKSVQVTSSGAVLTLRLSMTYGWNGAVNGKTTIVVDSPKKNGSTAKCRILAAA